MANAVIRCYCGTNQLLPNLCFCLFFNEIHNANNIEMDKKAFIKKETKDCSITRFGGEQSFDGVLSVFSSTTVFQQNKLKLLTQNEMHTIFSN